MKKRRKGVGKQREEIPCKMSPIHCCPLLKSNWVLYSGINLLLPFAMLSLPQMIETDDDFNPLPNGYDYLVDFLDLSFPKERPNRDHPYEEVSNSTDGQDPSM